VTSGNVRCRFSKAASLNIRDIAKKQIVHAGFTSIMVLGIVL